jgi:hypothetical protein
MIDTRQIHIGATVVLRPDFGAGAPVIATITGFGIKNNHHLVDYWTEDGPRWAYLNQIDRIITQTPERMPK